MRNVIAMLAALLAVSAVADEAKMTAPPAKGTTIHPTDQYGNVQNHQPSWVAKDDGRIVAVSPYGQEQHHKPGFQVKGDRVYQTDPQGRIQYNKPSYTVEASRRIVETNPYGQKQFHKPGFQVQGDEIRRTDRYGNRKEPAYVVKDKTPPARDEK